MRIERMVSVSFAKAEETYLWCRFHYSILQFFFLLLILSFFYTRHSERACVDDKQILKRLHISFRTQSYILPSTRMYKYSNWWLCVRSSRLEDFWNGETLFLICMCPCRTYIVGDTVCVCVWNGVHVCRSIVLVSSERSLNCKVIGYKLYSMP